jgi:hypothetical protein
MNTKDETALRKYLLGKASSEEQEDIEHWLMSDGAALDLLEAAEDDLIDEVLAGRLTGADVDRFNDHFLAAPERSRKYEFSRSFKRAIAARANSVSTTQPAPRNFVTSLLDALRRRPLLANIAVGLFTVLVVGTLWSAFRIVTLQRELSSTTAQLADAGRDRDGLKRQLDETQSETRTLEDRLQALETANAQKPSIPAAIAALTLLPGLTRSAADMPVLRLDAGTSTARFSLALPDDSFSSFRVSLTGADGREIWSDARLSATRTADGNVVVSTIPADMLPPGDYTFTLFGIAGAASAESIGKYAFRVVR